MCSCNAVVTGKELGAARWRREHRSGERQRPAKLPHDGRVAGMRRTHRDAAGPHRTAQPTQCSKRTATQRFRQMQDGLRAPCFFSSRVEHARTSPPPRRRRAELQGQNRRWLAASRLCSPSCERKHNRGGRTPEAMHRSLQEGSRICIRPRSNLKKKQHGQSCEGSLLSVHQCAAAVSAHGQSVRDCKLRNHLQLLQVVLLVKIPARGRTAHEKHRRDPQRKAALPCSPQNCRRGRRRAEGCRAGRAADQDCPVFQTVVLARAVGGSCGGSGW